MKKIEWIVGAIIIIAVTTVVCQQLFLYPFNESLFYAVRNWGTLALATGLGYLLISFIEKKQIFGIFFAMLMPCMPTFGLWLIALVILPVLGYSLLALLPLLLIASGVGGVWAHKKRIKKMARSL